MTGSGDVPAGGATGATAMVTFVVAMPAEVAGPVLTRHGGRRLDSLPGAVPVVAAAFVAAADAVAAAMAVQELAGGDAVRDGVAVAVHTGYAWLPDHYRHTGPALRRCQWLCDVASAGQVLVSAQAAVAVAGRLPPGTELRDLGPHRLRDLAPAERVFTLTEPGKAEPGKAEPGKAEPGKAEPAPVPGLVDRPPRSLDAVPNNLPVHLTSFVGRAAALAQIRPLLAGARLVTLTGAGGTGKSRLAAQVAAEQVEDWPDGVWWVELAAVTDPAAVAEAVAATIGALAEPAADQIRSATAHLRDQRALICLDNCEQVLDGAAELAEALLRRCPDVTVLATSREPLNAPGETVWRVPSLDPDEAVSLFVERSRTVLPYLAVDAASEPAIRSMCARVDGIPLALELAAAWMRTLTPAQIEAGLDDRFALLVRGTRGAAARHQTLAASLDWSHDLLAETERRVFRRLAVFAGGFDLAAARAVCDDPPATVLAALARLVDMSLVVAEERVGQARYRLLETLHAYAWERLAGAGEETVARDRHLDHYLALAEAAEPELDRDLDAWRVRVEPERDNLRAALAWGLAAADPDRGRRLAAALPWLWNLRADGREGLDQLRRAIDRAPADRSRLQARLLAGYAQVADTVAPYDLAAAEQGLALATELDEPQLRSRCLTLTALGQLFQDPAAGWERSVVAQQLAEAAGHPAERDHARGVQALLLHLRDQHEPAMQLLAEVTDGLLRRGDRGIASTLFACWSSSALVTGDLAGAGRLAQRAVAVAEPLGDHHRVGRARSQLAIVLGQAGQFDAAMAVLDPILRLVEDESPVPVPGLGLVMGQLLGWQGEADQALWWLARDVPRSGPATESLLAAAVLPGYGAALRRAGRRTEAAATLTHAAGLAGRFDLPRCRADALEQLGWLAAAGDPEQAMDLHHQALAIRIRHQLRLSYVDSLEALGGLLARSGRRDRAARVLAAAVAARDRLGYPHPPADLPEHQTLVAQLRSDPDLAAAWEEGAGMGLDAATSYVRRARGTRHRPASGWDSLTPTEREVVRLAVEGLSNPAIGARMFVSRGTVKTHLAHVYAKLGVSNRTELAALAAARSDAARLDPAAPEVSPPGVR